MWSVLVLEILDVSQIILSIEDIRRVAEMEIHPEVRRWDMYAETERAPSQDLQASIKGFKEFFEKARKDENQLCLLAKLDGNVVGWLGIHRLDKPKRHVGDVGITIHPDYQRRGIGTELLKAGISLARKRGFKRLEIVTLAENKAMRRAAEKAGFHLEGIRRKAVNMQGKLRDEALYAILL